MFLTEKDKILTVLQPDADRYDSDPASDIVFMGDYNHACFVLSEGAGGTGTATLTVEECSDNAGTANVAIPFRYREMSTIDTLGAITEATAAGFTTTAGANKMVFIEIDGAELSADKPWVKVQLTEVANSAVDAGMICILSEGRFKGNSQPSVL